MIETTTSDPIFTFNLQAATAWLKPRLHTKRLDHSLGTHHKAIELAEKFKLNPKACQQTAIAGLLHDCAKLLSPPELLGYCETHQLELSADDLNCPQTIHAIVGAHMVQKAFHISDDDTLNAIRYHTTARDFMTNVEKIVFIADKIEGNTRNPIYIRKVTEHLNHSDPASLDRTMQYLLDSTIGFLLEKHQFIHPRTIRARNYFLLQQNPEKCV